MKKALIVVILLGMPWGAVFSVEPSGVKELTLKDAIYYALKNNPGLQVQRTRTRAARLNLRFNRAQLYLPRLTVDSQYSKSRRPSTTLFDGVDFVEGEETRSTVTIIQRTPLGGTFSFSFFNRRQETNVITFPFNPLLVTAGTVSYRQPLLRNFGTLAANYQIRIAANDHQMSKYQLEEAIVDLVYEVESAYWELVFAHQNLEAAQTALKRAKDLLHQNEIKVKVGTAAPIEILSSKATVARNESTVIQAKQAIQTREEALKRILNMSKEPFSIIPIDKPEIKNLPLDFDTNLKEAIENRADVKQAKINLERSELDVKYQRNQALPNLQLYAGLTSYGVGGTFWFFPIRDPFDPDFQKIMVEEITFMDTIKDALKLENNFFNVSLNLRIPIPTTAERAQLARAKIQRERAVLELKDLENTIYSEVNDVIRQLENNKKLVEADRIAVELEDENLKVEEKKLSIGLSTNFQVLQYQEQYASAQTQLLRSTIDFVLTNARVNQVLNRTLKFYNLKFNNIFENKINR
ncbi:MAG: TolC family protein [Candidatus Aminicenantes bacterium]|nr:MAG: TolC family protein [Candidatus Aminicenantes bacterium]